MHTRSRKVERPSGRSLPFAFGMKTRLIAERVKIVVYTKVRYKGIAKNAAQVFSLIGLTNLYLARRALMS